MEHSVEKSNASLFKKLSLIFGIGALLSVLWVAKYYRDLSTLKNEYLAKSKVEEERVRQKLNEKLGYVYQAVRTMSLVPGVRKIKRSGSNFDEDAKMTIQQLYNNAFLNIKVSEIYLLPRSMDPDKIDPKTQKGEEPIVTFDELITSSSSHKDEAQVEEKAPEMEELEIEEYRLMKVQLETLAQKYPTNKSFKDLEIPMLSGPEVITCDNSEFTLAELEKHDDTNRKGIVFTVPVYDMEGKFAGGVSAVLRSNVIRSLVPKGSYGIVNQAHSFVGVTDPSDSWKASLEHFSKGSKNPNLIYSQIETLDFPDNNVWQLWSAKSDDEFWSSEQILGLKKVFWGTLLFLWLLTFGLMWQSKRDFATLSRIMKSTYELSGQLSNLLTSISDLDTSSKSISTSSQSQAAAIQESAQSMEEITAMVSQSSSGAEAALGLAEEGKSSSVEGKDVVTQLQSAMRDIESTQSEIEKIAQVMNDINSKTSAINDIVFQTRLLAFNASIESARAGVHGKGFSVVAEEVGKLAAQSGKAATEISTLVKDSLSVVQDTMSTSSDRIRKGRELSEKCHESFQKMIDGLNEIGASVNSVTSASREQVAGIKQTNIAIQEMDKVTQRNANIAHDIEVKVDNLKKVAEIIEHNIQQLLGNKAPKKLSSDLTTRLTSSPRGEFKKAS
jgi:uncharacterized protein YlxW (UPF0749 family)